MQGNSQPLARRKLEIGPYAVHALPTGVFGLDGGAMFGTVPRTLWEKTNPPDDHNRIELEARALLLVSAKRKILVDVGLGGDFVQKYGEKLGSKFAEIYAVSGGHSFEKALEKFGLQTPDITDVILTHLHFDHAGGGTRWNGEKLVPTFPKATYYVQKKNLETAEKPNLREKASYFPANFKPLLEAGCLKLLDGGVRDLFDGVHLFVTNGHTQAQQLVEISDDKTKLIYCGDIIPTSSHVRLPFVMGYDLNPLLVIEEKRQILSRVSGGKGYVYFEHDPHCDAAAVEGAGDDFRVTEKLAL
jgi:glyoxylase-like metal-dependent hydrolase (beta-lactamase superfamily II)